MSRTIDEKVVEMRFDNRDFEQNVSQSMSTLDKLKNALKFDDAEKTFSKMSSAATKIDFGPLSTAIEGVGQKFSALETIAVGALMNIGASIERNLVDMLKSVTVEPIMSGFEKYADKTKAVQTIMNATGNEIGVVSDQLSRLNWFTDETSYNFSDMVSNIGKFTSSGVDLDKAVTAMEGIANWAAISGQGTNEAARAMYNLSQSLSSGYVMVRDWMSIENANMATKEFKQMAIEAAVAEGTLAEFYDEEKGESFYATYSLDEFGNAIAETEVDWMNFRDTLQKKWFTDKALVKVLNNYGGFTDKLSEVYDELNKTTDITTSQIIKLTNEYVDGTLDMDKAMLMTGKSAEELQQIFAELGSEEYDLGRRAFAAAQEAKTFREAIDATKDAVSTGWMNTFELLFGNYEEAKVLWTDLANELWEIFAGPISDMNDMLLGWKNLGGRDEFIQSIKNLYHAIRSFVDPIGEAWEAIFPKIDSHQLYEFTKRLNDMIETMALSEEKVEMLREGFEGFFSLVKHVSGMIKEVSDAFFEGFKKSNSFSRELSNVLDGFRNFTSNASEFILTVRRAASAFSQYASGALNDYAIVADYLENHPIASAVAKGFNKLKESNAIIGKLAGSYFSLSKTMLIYGESGGGIAGIVELFVIRIKEAIEAIRDLVKVWSGVDISDWFEPVLNILFRFRNAIEDLQSAGYFDRIIEKINAIGDAFTARFGGLKDFLGPLGEAISSIWKDFFEGIGMLMGVDEEGIKGFFDAIESGLDSVREFVETSPTLGKIVDTFKELIRVTSEFLAKFLSLSSAIRTFQEAGGGLAGLIAVVGEKFHELTEFVFDFIESLTGLDLHVVGQGIEEVFRVIKDGLLFIADFIATKLGWEDNPFGKLIEDSDFSLKRLTDIFQGFGKIDLSGLASLGEKIKEKLAPFDSVIQGLKNLFGGLWAVIQKLMPMVGAFLSFIGDALNNLASFIGELTFKDLLEMIKTGGLIYLFVKMGGAFDAVGEALEAWQVKLKVDTLHTLAVAILEIAAAAAIIALIPKDKVIGSLEGIGVALAGLIVYVATAMGMSGKADAKSILSISTTLNAVGIALIEIAIAMNLMVKPIEEISKLDPEKLKQSIIGILGILGELSGALIVSSVTGKISSGVSGYLAIAKSLGMMLVVLKLFSMMDTNTIYQGMANVTAVLSLLGIYMTVLSLLDALTSIGAHGSRMGQLGESMKNLSEAMIIMAGALFILSKADPQGLQQGILVLAEAMGVMVAAMIGFAFATTVLAPVVKHMDVLSKTLKNFALALGVTVLAVAGLGLLATILGDNAKAFVDAAINMVVMVLDALADRADDIADDLCTILLEILKSLERHMPEIVSTVISLLKKLGVEVGKAFANLGDVGNFLEGAGLIGGMIGLVILLRKIKLTIKDFTRAATVIAGAAILVAEMGALFVALGAISSKIGGAEKIKKAGEVAKEISSVFKQDSGGVALMFAALAGMMVLLNKFAGDEMSTDGKKVIKKSEVNFKSIMKTVGQLGTLILGVTALVVELAAIFAIAGAVGDWMNMKEGIQVFGEILGALSEAFTADWGVPFLFAFIATILVAMTKLESDGKLNGIKQSDIWKSVGLVAELLGVTITLVTSLAAIFAGLGAAVNDIESKTEAGSISEAIQSYAEVISSLASVFIGPLGIMFTAVAGLIVLAAGIKDKFGIDADSITRASLDIGELFGVTIVLMTGMASIFGGLGAAVNDIESKTEAGSISEAIQNYADVMDTLASAFAGPLGTMFAAVSGIILLMASLKDKFGIDAGSIASATGNLAELFLFATALMDELALLFSASNAMFEFLDGNQRYTVFDDSGNAKKVYTGMAAGIMEYAEIISALADVLVGPLGALMLGIGAIVLLFTKLNLDFSTLIEAGGEVALFLAEVVGIIDILALVIAATGELAAWFDAWASEEMGANRSMPVLKASIEYAGDIFEALANAIGRLVGGLVNGFGVSATAGLAEIAGNLNAFTSTLSQEGGFIDSMKMMDGSILEGVGHLAGAILALTAADVLDALFGWATGEADYGKFGEQLATLGPGLVVFAKSMKDVSEDDVKKATSCAEMIGAFTDKIPRQGGLFQMIVGEKNLGDFGRQLGQFGTGLKKFAAETTGLESDVFENAKVCANIVMEFANKVPQNLAGSLLGKLIGTNDLETFGNNLVSFGTSMVSFQSTAQGLSKEVLDHASDCASVVMAFAEKVPAQNNGSVFAWLTGEDTSLKKFGDNLVSFGGSLSDFDKKVKDVNFTRVEQAISSVGVDTISDLIGAMTDSKAMSSVASAVVKLMDELKSDIVSSINGKLGDSQYGMTTIRHYGELIVSKINAGMTDDAVVSELSTSVGTLLDEIKTSIETKSTTVPESGKNVLEKFKLGFLDGITRLTIRTEFMEFLDRLLGDIEGYFDDFKQAGLDLINQFSTGLSEGSAGITLTANAVVDGFANGLSSDENLAKVKAATNELAKTADEGIKAPLSIRSPSRVTAQTGEYVVLGFIKGIADNTYQVEFVADEMGGIFIESLNDSLGIHSPSDATAETADNCILGFIGEIAKKLDAIGMSADTFADMFLGRYADKFKNFVHGKTGTISELLGLFATDDSDVTSVLNSWYDNGEASSDSWLEGFLKSQGYNSDELSNNMTDVVSSLYDDSSSDGYYTGYNYMTGVGDGLEAAGPYLTKTVSMISNDAIDSAEENVAISLDNISNMETSGPVIVPVVDTSVAEEQMDGLIEYVDGAATYTINAMNGELDGLLLNWSLHPENLDQNAAEKISYLTKLANGTAADAEALNQQRWDALEAEQLNVQQSAQAIESQNEMLEEVRGIREEVGYVREDLTNLQVVMDSGELVGAIGSKMDDELGNRNVLTGRRII